MKKIYILLTSVVLLFAGCSDFLNMKPRDTRVVSTIEDYRDIMANYLYLIKKVNPGQIPVFGGYNIYPKFMVADRIVWYTGEIGVSRSSSSYYNPALGVFTSAAVSLLTWTNTADSEWGRFFSFLGPLNMIVNGVKTAKGTDENLRQYVLGEALVWRSYAYFKLLQYYAPYKDNAYGIPICLDPTYDIGNAMPKRETQTYCYNQIISDLNAALDLLDKTAMVGDWNFIFRRDLVNAMLASVYTYKAMSGAAEITDWERAYKHANAAIGNRMLSNNSIDLKSIFDCRAAVAGDNVISDEIFIRMVDGNNTQLFNFVPSYVKGDTNDGTTTLEYSSIYTDNDIRKAAYFSGTVPDKYNIIGTSGGCIIPNRLAEMYLIRAEALVRQNKVGEARLALELFCAKRYIMPPSIPTDQIAVLNMILLERKKEFFQENDLRWLDMKRLGETREVIVNGEIYKLEANDFRYSFPIPAREMKANLAMIQTPGWDKFLLN